MPILYILLFIPSRIIYKRFNMKVKLKYYIFICTIYMYNKIRLLRGRVQYTDF